MTVKEEKSVQYVTQHSFEQNESNIGKRFNDSGSESSSNSPGFTCHEEPHLGELFINDGSQEWYNVNWLYINLTQLQSAEDVCGE